ncbi:serine hydrolase domain-containing protein [Candidatus Poriferisodalis sp.]|uniref:serine hydrolase domain-containing protein n=1 Tax=Candidatus Poriferisodalis sp. TaxID=3101277 RepID=UPI003B02DCC6
MKRLAAALLSLGLLTAACSSADDTAPTTAATSPVTTEAPAPAATAAPSTTAATPAATEAPASTAAPATTAVPQHEAEAESRSESSEGSQAGAEPADPLGAAVAEWMERTGAPGLVLAVTQGGAEPATFAWGLSDIATGVPMTVDHHVRIGSVTKPVTAAVVLQLASEDLVELDAPVAQYLGDDWAPGYEHAAAVTVRDLLGHTSGFVEYAFDVQFYQLAAPRLAEQISPEEILQFAAEYGPVAELGTERHYNTTGYLAAGLLIEAVTGNTAAAELRSRVFEPLGLQHTYLTPEEFPPEPTANGYVGGTIGYLMGPLLGLTSDNQITHGDAIFVDVGTVPSDFARSAGWTGGGIEAQIGDVALLIRGLFATDILDDEQVALMTAGHPMPDSSYGLGISTDEILGVTIYTHGGGVPGFRTIAAYAPALDLGIALTTNLLGLEGPDDVGGLLESLAPILATRGQQ